MAMSHGRALAALAAGMLSRAWAEGGLCETGSCRGPAGAVGQDHMLIQVQRGSTSRAEEKGPLGCRFAIPPETPYYREPQCYMGMVGCWADGVNAECRFCDYEGIECPASAVWPGIDTCDFANEPPPANVGYYYEEGCPAVDGGLGCNADGKHQGCRLCGGDGDYAEIECKVDQCTFANEPNTPYFFDKSCEMGMLGCMADGIHLGCRYCGKRPYDGIECLASARIPKSKCWFRNEPAQQHYWEPACEKGMLGCWADGIHAECRFCGGEAGSVYAGVPCK